MASLCKRQQCTIKLHGFRQELDSWRHKLIQCVDLPSFLYPLITPAAKEIVQCMIQKLALEYTSKNSSAQDLPPFQSVFKNATYQSLPKAPLLDPAANIPNCLFGYTGTIIAASSRNSVLCKGFMADQNSPLDLTVRKTGESSNQDGVLDLSTKKKQSRISFEHSHDFSVIPVVKRQPVITDQTYHDIQDKDGLLLQGLQHGIWENHTCSTPFKPLLSKSLFIKEEFLSKKHRFLGQPTPLSFSSLEAVGFLNSNQTHPLLSPDSFWENQQLEGVLECKPASSYLGDLKNHPLVVEKNGTFTKSTSACHSKSLDIIAITAKKEAKNSPLFDLKIPQVKGMDLSWNSSGNISDAYNYSSVTMGSVQIDNSLSRRLRAILPKQSSRAALGSLSDVCGGSKNLGTDTDQLTSGPQYPTSDPEAEPTVSKQPRRKRGRYRQYNSEILEEAIGVVMSGKMSVSKAQNIYGIPHSTLEYKVKERMGTLKNPPKKKLKMIMRIDRLNSEFSADTECSSAPTASFSRLQEGV
ncbi:ligand-dependent corepressor [Silurus asotus]|uniref:Ligand-dependent corepressor n=1 Tax=Silurus asotus TaxID=30991 RepID=A0AAD5B7S8_SILAS|nr:ligand-dependent corepressor [Silurus asotus]